MIKLTKPQERMLREIVATNGGGISGFILRERVMRALESKGLIQGKLNASHRAVHTRIGLEWVRNNPTRPTGGSNHGE